jgi:hypothetical protein
MSSLNGSKTYIVAAIGVGLVILSHIGWLPAGVVVPDNTVIMAALAATLRHGISTSTKK